MIQFNQKKFVKCLLGPAANTGDNSGEQVNIFTFSPSNPTVEIYSEHTPPQ